MTDGLIQTVQPHDFDKCDFVGPVLILDRLGVHWIARMSSWGAWKAVDSTGTQYMAVERLLGPLRVIECGVALPDEGPGESWYEGYRTAKWEEGNG